MAKYVNNNQLDELEAPLENALGLVTALEDLISRDSGLLLNYSTADNGKENRATRFATELQTLATTSLEYLTRLDAELSITFSNAKTLDELNKRDGEE